MSHNNDDIFQTQNPPRDPEEPKAKQVDEDDDDDTVSQYKAVNCH